MSAESLDPKEEQDFAGILREAGKGEIAAQVRAARSYFFGEGVPVDEKLAADWYEKAAEQGDAEAQHATAGMYWNGLGRAQDQARALIWYRRAAEQNHAPALSTLGYLYAQGESVPQDDAEASFWYHRAFEFTDQLLCLPDHEEIFWIRRAAANDALAQTIIGRMFETGFGRKQSHAEALTWYQKAADQNFAEAEQHLARLTGRS